MLLEYAVRRMLYAACCTHAVMQNFPEAVITGNINRMQNFPEAVITANIDILNRFFQLVDCETVHSGTYYY